MHKVEENIPFGVCPARKCMGMINPVAGAGQSLVTFQKEKVNSDINRCWCSTILTILKFYVAVDL